jgi:hypothetical protein
MKKTITVLLLLIAGFLTAPQTNAQVRVGININIGDQPRWRAPGYDYVEYYYLPDIESYYYVPTHQFIYLSNGRWIFSTSLPYRYRNYDLYGGYKVVINRPNAYYHHNEYKIKYNRNKPHTDNGLHRGWNKNKKGRGRH